MSFFLLAFVALAAAGVIVPDSSWLDALFGRRKWSHIALPLTLVNHYPLYGFILAALLWACALLTIRVILQGRWQEGAGGLLILLLLYFGGAYPFIRGYYKQFKAVKTFALEVAKTVGPQDPLYAYKLPELSQIYFYLQRHVPSASCARTDDLSRCPPGYYLVWEKTWEERKDRLRGKAAEVIRSRTLSGPAARVRTVLIRLDHLAANRSL